MWHVSSRSGLATLCTDIHLLLTYVLNPDALVHQIQRAEFTHSALSVTPTVVLSLKTAALQLQKYNETLKLRNRASCSDHTRFWVIFHMRLPPPPPPPPLLLCPFDNTNTRQTDTQTQGHGIYGVLESALHGSWWRGTVVERRSLAGELSLSCA